MKTLEQMKEMIKTISADISTKAEADINKDRGFGYSVAEFDNMKSRANVKKVSMNFETGKATITFSAAHCHKVFCAVEDFKKEDFSALRVWCMDNELNNSLSVFMKDSLSQSKELLIKV